MLMVLLMLGVGIDVMFGVDVDVMCVDIGVVLFMSPPVRGNPCNQAETCRYA